MKVDSAGVRPSSFVCAVVALTLASQVDIYFQRVEVSLAEARQNLAAIVHEAERQSPVALTRRGEPVAILLSIQEYQRLLAKETRFWDAYTAFRNTVDLTQIDIDTDIFHGIRDPAPGREVDW